jgi:hypothetical protein
MPIKKQLFLIEIGFIICVISGKYEMEIDKGIKLLAYFIDEY